MRQSLGCHGGKFASFSVVGGVVFVEGLALQAALTSGLHVASFISYLVQAVVSVESSFFLNRQFTWRKAETPFWTALWRFNAQKIITVAANVLLYVPLLKLGINYLVANILLTIVFTFVNYVVADRFVFLRRTTSDLLRRTTSDLLRRTNPDLVAVTAVSGVSRLTMVAAADAAQVSEDLRATTPLPGLAWNELPTVSVVIPCRGNADTIRAAVDSILGQGYPVLQELILVGSPGDSTWQALEGITDYRVSIMETETPPGIRDANFKRDFGIRYTCGELVCLIDSDMVIPPDWMSNAVRLLRESKSDCVTGVMRSIHDDFWGRFVDNNWLVAKTPRVTGSHLVTARNFGAHGQKPPIAANILFKREMYDHCPIDSSWSHGSLEDYEWFWRVAKGGHRVLVSGTLFGWHHHRAGLRGLAAEYRRSARGCAYFIRAHGRSPFARTRLTQVIVLPLSSLAMLGCLAVGVMTGHGKLTTLLVLAFALISVLLLSAREFVQSHTLESLTYPVSALVFGVNYTASLIINLIKNGTDPAAGKAGTSDRHPGATARVKARQAGLLFTVLPMTALLALKANTTLSLVRSKLRRREHRVGYARRPVRWIIAAFAAAFAVGISLRLWRLGESPAWQWDEIVYWLISANVQHGVLSEHAVYGVPWQPFLYQPPMFFMIESRWFDLVGASIYHARLFGIACTAVMQVLLFRLLWRLHGPRIALFAILPVIFDGWLLYIERVSYIENALMIFVVLAFLLYKRALDMPSWQRYLVAGAAVGAAATFKQTGAYVVPAVLLCWLILHREHKKHFVLIGGAVLVISAYLCLMVYKYDAPGHPYFIDQSLHQVRRVLGLQRSGGTLTSPVRALHLLTAQYKYFASSLLVAVAGFLIAVRRTLQCVRARTWEPVQPNAILYSWLVSGVVVFGLSSLKFPQYFALVLLPAYCYLWTELARSDLRPMWLRFWSATAIIAATGSFLLMIPTFSVNPLAEVQVYAARQIPASAIVVTEESIGDLIQQRWCAVEKANACVGHATYAITWKTYLQSSFDQGDASFRELMKDATRITSFSGSVGTATVWKLRR